MESLIALASEVEVVMVRLRGRREARIRALHVRFSRATPNRLKPGVLPATYTEKPLVSVHGDAMFGELAIVRWLERDGWSGAWVDVAHGGALWRGMPHRSPPVAPAALPAPARARLEAVRAANDGRVGGFFDVMAWRGEQVIHLRYAQTGTPPSRAEVQWIEAAIDAGVSAGDLWMVLHPTPEPRDEDGGA